MFGSKDPEQVNTMAKQAGEVSVGNYRKKLLLMRQN